MANITRFDPIGEMVSLRHADRRQIRINAGTGDASETSRNGSAAS